MLFFLLHFHLILFINTCPLEIIFLIYIFIFNILEFSFSLSSGLLYASDNIAPPVTPKNNFLSPKEEIFSAVFLKYEKGDNIGDFSRIFLN